MNNLGDMYENGVGVGQDYAEAMKLYRQAAALGQGVAFRSLASMWESGKAGKVNQRQAYLYYLLAGKLETAPPDTVQALKQQLGADDQGLSKPRQKNGNWVILCQMRELGVMS